MSIRFTKSKFYKWRSQFKNSTSSKTPDEVTDLTAKKEEEEMSLPLHHQQRRHEKLPSSCTILLWLLLAHTGWRQRTLIQIYNIHTQTDIQINLGRRWCYVHLGAIKNDISRRDKSCEAYKTSYYVVFVAIHKAGFFEEGQISMK